MEQLQTVLTVVKKHHFWILAGLVLVIAMAVYVMATGALKKEYEDRERKIESAKATASSVSGEANQKVIDEWEKLHDIQNENVINSWAILHRRQEKDNPWPSVLGEEFRQWVEKNKDDPQKTMPLRLREEYQYFIDQQLPKLFEVVNYLRPENITDGADDANPASPDGRKPGSDQGIMIGVVNWPEDQRVRIMESYLLERKPSTLEVHLLQEDYWVYQALLNIIKQTNGNAKTSSAAAVKKIEELLIGQDAVTEMQSNQGLDLLGSVLAVKSSSTSRSGTSRVGMPGGGGDEVSGGYGDGGYGDGGYGDGGGESADDTGEMGGGTTTLSVEDQELLNNRYVKGNLTPLTAGQLAAFKEFKMMPVFMKLRIHQRHISDLQVKCANSTMPVEIKQLRFQINPNAKSTGNVGRGTRRRTPRRGMGGGDFGGGNFGGRSPTRTGAANQEGDDQNPYVISVELRGIIYIYNRPQKEKSVAESNADDTTDSEGTPPADETATDGTEPTATTDESAPKMPGPTL